MLLISLSSSDDLHEVFNEPAKELDRHVKGLLLEVRGFSWLVHTTFADGSILRVYSHGRDGVQYWHWVLVHVVSSQDISHVP